MSGAAARWFKNSAFSLPVTPESLASIVCFNGAEAQGRRRGSYNAGAPELWDVQMAGTAWLFNAMVEHGVAYLADEVGMGKTYQALGVIAATYAAKPHARVVVISPRRNVQTKWVQEYLSFVGNNYVSHDDRCKDRILGWPIHPPAFSDNLWELADNLLHLPHGLHFIRLTSFMRPLALRDAETPHAAVKRGLQRFANMGYHPTVRLGQKRFPRPDENAAVQQWVIAALREVLPPIDLLVIDEAQNLRRRDNQRNTHLARLFGLASSDDAPGFIDGIDWTQGSQRVEGQRGSISPWVDRALLLSATPTHASADDLTEQLRYFPRVFAKAERAGIRPGGGIADEFLHQVLLRRLRRFAGKTKYRYRQEKLVPCATDDAYQQLTIALIQKSLVHLVEANQNRFKIGLLSSFESMAPSQRVGDAEVATHDGDDPEIKAADETYLAGLQSRLAELVGGCQERVSLPHPKQDGLVDEAERLMLSAKPEKLLVFVRRLASVRELVARLVEAYDRALEGWIDEAMGLADGKRVLFEQLGTWDVGDELQQEDELPHSDQPDDHGDASSARPDDDLSRAEDHYQKQSLILREFARSSDTTGPGKLRRLLVGNAKLSALFTENPARLLLESRLQQRGVSYEAWLADQLGGPMGESTLRYIRQVAELNGVYRSLGSRRQLQRARAASVIPLAFLRATQSHPDLDDLAGAVRQLAALARVDLPAPESLTTPARLPEHDKILQMLRRKGVWDHIRRHSAECLRPSFDFLHSSDWARRDVLKAWIDKCLRMSEGIVLIGIAWTGGDGAESTTAEQLADLLAGTTMLARRSRHRVHEMCDAEVYQPLLKTLATGGGVDLAGLADERWRDLDDQHPAVGVVSGSRGRERAVAQFKTPFFPDVLVATSTLAEGVDLHLFCDTVWHYGLAWTPGEMEQRTGRVDRFFSKAFRRVRRNPDVGSDALTIGYPYLPDTIDELQLARVLQAKQVVEPLMDAGVSAQAVAKEVVIGRTMPGFEGLNKLRTYPNDSAGAESRFADKAFDLGEAQRVFEYVPRAGAEYSRRLGGLIDALETRLYQRAPAQRYFDQHGFRGAAVATIHLETVFSDRGAQIRLRQKNESLPDDDQSGSVRGQSVHLRIELDAQSRTHVIRALSPVGDLPRDAERLIDHAEMIHARFPGIRLCHDPRKKRCDVDLTVEGAIQLGPAEQPGGLSSYTSPAELLDLVERVTLAADLLEYHLYRGFDKATWEVREDTQ